VVLSLRIDSFLLQSSKKKQKKKLVVCGETAFFGRLTKNKPVNQNQVITEQVKG
jgi:hypothetical protein